MQKTGRTHLQCFFIRDEEFSMLCGYNARHLLARVIKQHSCAHTKKCCEFGESPISTVIEVSFVLESKM
jgi:hypothetical protein